MFARLSLLFASAGLFIASYLTATYYSGVLIPCGPAGGCSDALYNPSYHVKGVPLAAIGVAYCLVLISSILIWMRVQTSRSKTLLQILALIGWLAGVILNVHLSESGSSCAWCLGFVTTIVLCWASLSVSSKSASFEGAQFAWAILFALLTLGAGLVLGSKERDVDDLDPRILAQHANQMVSLESPRLGNPTKKVVLFGEIACPSCRIAMNKLLPYAEEGKIQLVIRHLPIETHPISREACALAQLAYEDGKLAELIRAVDGRIVASKEELNEIAKELNLPEPSAGGTEQIDKDAKFAQQLGITGAPTLIWIEGDKLPQHLSLSEIEARLNQ